MPITLRILFLLATGSFFVTPPVLGIQVVTPDSTAAVPGEVRTPRSTTVSKDALELFPGDEVIEFIEQQPGIVDGHMRGGRSGEIAYYYGRIPIINPFYNRPALEIEPGMLRGIRVRPGIVDSRFGYGMSGVVLLEPLSMPTTWTARVSGQAGAFASARELEFLRRETESAGAMDLADFEIDRVAFNDAAELPAVADLQFLGGGPVLGNRVQVLLNGRYVSKAGHMLGRRLFTPTDGITAFTGRPRNEWIVRSNGDERFVQLGGEDRLTVSAKAQARVAPAFDLSYEAVIQTSDRRPYDHSQKYVPDGSSRAFDRAQLHVADFVYGEGSNTRSWGHYAYMSDRRGERLYDDPTDERYVFQGPGNGANAFDAGGNDLNRTSTRIRTHMAAITAAHRFLEVHEVRAGAEARVHRIQRKEGRVEVLPNGEARMSLNPIFDNRIDVHPSELAAFVDATIQIERFTIEAGIRSTYFDPAAEVPLDWTRASSLFIPNTVGTVYYDPEEGDTIRNREDAPIQSWISPRFELSFPIGDQTRFWFGGGSLYQMPPLQVLYANLDYELGVGSIPQLPTVYANPSLEPERTLHVEMGVEHQLNDALDLEVALFGKDVKNLTGYTFERGVVTASLVARPVNVDEAQVRGATVSLLSRPSETATLSWSVDYSLLFVEGTASSMLEAFHRFASGLDANRSQVRLDWDRRHVLHNSIVWRPSARLTLALQNRLQSPLPYNMAVTNRPEYIVTGDDTPVQLIADARLWYRIPAGNHGLDLFLQVKNLTDARVGRSVFSGTGMSADLYETGRHLLLDEEVEGVNSLQEYADDRFYLSPRTVSLGLTYRF